MDLVLVNGKSVTEVDFFFPVTNSQIQPTVGIIVHSNYPDFGRGLKTRLFFLTLVVSQFRVRLLGRTHREVIALRKVCPSLPNLEEHSKCDLLMHPGFWLFSGLQHYFTYLYIPWCCFLFFLSFFFLQTFY